MKMNVFFDVYPGSSPDNKMKPVEIDLTLDRTEGNLTYLLGSLPEGVKVGTTIGIVEPIDVMGTIVEITDDGFVVREPL